MAQSLTWYPSLAKFFPKDDPLARLMARLFVLWQDLLYEHEGMCRADGFAALDHRGNGEMQRRLYFLRANSRTLNSAKYLFDALKADVTFAGWLNEEPTLAVEFLGAKKAFDKHRAAIERVRNTIGAHVEQDLGEAIAEFMPGDTARFEIHSEDVIRPHLATDIVLAALTRDAAPDRESRTKALRTSIEPLAQATNAMIRGMSAAAGAYAERYQLLPR